jgi:diguanylate cyclase (GGDEF)-like protein
VAPSSGSQRLRLGLDIAIVVVVGAMVVWWVSLREIVVDGAGSAVELGTSVAYPLGDLFLVAALGFALVRWSPPALRRSLALILAGLSMFILADIVYSHALLTGGYVAGGPIDTLWIVALALFAIAGAVQRPVAAGSAEAEVPAREAAEGRASVLPAAGLAVGFAVLLASEWEGGLVRDMSLIVTGAVLAGLIAVRQFVTQQQLIRLQRELRFAHDELVELASRDVLTGAANRRAIEETLGLEVARARRHQRHVSVLFLDVDHFKSINDDFGHKAGDRVLVDVAAVIGNCLRPTDIVGRWGGEEFVIVLPETDSAEAAAIGERIRARFEYRSFLGDDGRLLTCSIGVATYPAQAIDADTLIDLADNAMYQAKRLGRNRVSVAVTGVQARVGAAARHASWI